LTGASTSLVAAVTAASGLGHDHHLLHAIVFFLSSSSGGGVFDTSSNLSNFSIEFALELANVSMILVNSVLQFGITRLDFADTSTHPLDINLDMFEASVKSIKSLFSLTEFSSDHFSDLRGIELVITVSVKLLDYFLSVV
jgi:hypothetical protein